MTESLKATHETTTGHQAIDKNGSDLSPLEMVNSIIGAAEGAQEGQQQAEQNANVAKAQQKVTEG